jgi:predicted O-linked N-acetylglucosamine transferase (SPINDLY family)
MHRHADAQTSYQLALEIAPNFALAHHNLGVLCEKFGDLKEAMSSYRKAQQLGWVGSRVKAALMLPAIMGPHKEMFQTRAEFERNLDQLIADRVTLDDPLNNGGTPSFYLAYHGLNDRGLQMKVAQYYAQACPSLLYVSLHCTQPRVAAASKIRIGFFSRYLSKHSVSLSFSKILEVVSLREQFEVALISSHPIDEEIYAGSSGTRTRLPHNLVRAREMVAALALDILVYLDIGMEPLSYFMAFARLAPVQCVLGGHPVTTGIANVDYFLSSDLVEPANAQEHYSEKLVRFPSPVFYFSRPSVPNPLKTREELKLPRDGHIYMCPMRLQKMHPDFDAAISRLLQIDDMGKVVLFEDLHLPLGKKLLQERFEQTIPAALRERIVFLPWVTDPADFISMIAAADVVLDPYHFGIGTTAIMTFVTGTPLVTKTGEFMRGQVGTAWCKMLDVTECITTDTQAYTQKAFEIASTPLVRARISTKIISNSAVFYDNLQPIEYLVDFFSTITKTP